MSLIPPAARTGHRTCRLTRLAPGNQGATLIEVLIGLVIFGLVGAATGGMLARQHRLHRGFAEVGEVRNQLRDGASILATALRGVSPGGDFVTGTLGRTSLEIRSTFGASVACIISGGSRIVLPPATTLSDGRQLTHAARRAEPGNGVLVFDEGPTPADSDDVWLARAVTAVRTVANPCGGTPFTSGTDASLSGVELTLDAPVTAGVFPGAAVRLYERVRYSLYLGSDNLWYLGSCTAGSPTASCSTMQPLSGPYRPPHPDPSSGLGGLELSYHDDMGFATSNPAQVARIDVVLRAVTRTVISKGGEAGRSPFSDSARVSIALRNRIW